MALFTSHDSTDDAAFRPHRTLGYWIGVGASLSGVLGRGNTSSLDDMDNASPATSPGVASTDGPASIVAVSEKKAEKTDEHDDDEDEWDSEDDSEDEDGPVEGLDQVQAGLFEPCKMVRSILPCHHGVD